MEDTYKEWREPGRGKDVPKDCTSRHSLPVASKTLINVRKKVWENEFSHPFVLTFAIPFINAKILVAMRLGETPVLIPNTKVKT